MARRGLKMDFVESQICPVCKNRFVPAPMHVYKDARYDDVVSSASTCYRRRIYVCSWRCRRESERLLEKQTAKRKENRQTKKDIMKSVIKEIRNEMQDTAETKNT